MCRAKVVIQRATGEIVILQRAIIVRQGQVYASCPQCKTEILVESLSYETKSVVVRDSQDISQEKKVLTIPQPSVTINIVKQ